jgi:hypothetical protein
VSEQIAAAGQKVFEGFGAVAASPDDAAAAQAADDALWVLDGLLVAADAATPASAPPPAPAR